MNIRIALLFSWILILFQGCELIGDIFRTGVAVGVLIVVLIIGLIIYAVVRIRRR